MKNFLPLIIICLISCENKLSKNNCTIDFEIPKKTISYEGIVTDLKFHKNILTVSIFNLRNDTLRFPVPHLIFAKEIVKQNTKEPDNIVVKQFIPNIITDRVTAYCITEDNKKEIVSIDSSKTRDMKQYEFKLAPKAKYIVEYLLNCKESDPEKYKIFFFESNRFDDSKYEKIKYPENGYIEIKN
ncbi:hypothetical protein [Chryseobacterium sp. KCF3-3]|uniref:hypothetical protein n=1 Tax=Chryseobacterium sp. KCF3-3 TaxID=3231511 RepID=UPI0038B2C760